MADSFLNTPSGPFVERILTIPKDQLANMEHQPAGRSCDICITGAGLVTCLGLDRETTWKAVVRGECGMGPLTQVESRLDPDKGGGQVDDPDEGLEVDGSSPTKVGFREVRLLRRALHEAMDHAGIGDSLPYEPGRCAVVLGTSLHGMRNGGAFLRTGNFDWLRAFLAGATLAFAFDELEGIGFSTTNCSACSSGLASVSLGYTLLQSGEADLVLAGGYDPISEYSYAGFNSMRLVSPTTLRPFARTRDGMKLAEGYAIVVLERADDAAKRKAQPLVRVAGYGESCDAHHLSKPHPEGAGAVAAMRQALRSANIVPSDIDMLVAHATATPDNDKSEHAAMKQVFGDALPKVPVVGFKAHLGHSLGAAGTVDLILAALAIRDGIIPGRVHSDSYDVEFDDVRIGSACEEQRGPRHVLNMSLGFGGANACMIIASPQSTAGRQEHRTFSAVKTTKSRDAVVTGVGVILPGAVGVEAFERLVSSNGTLPVPLHGTAITDAEIENFLNARRTRRMSVLAKLCLAATTDAYRDARIDDPALFGENCSAIVGTMHGAAVYCERYYKQLIEEGVDAANPMLFAEGVPNVASAHLSTNFNLKGFCQSILGTATAGLEALHIASTRIRTGEWDRAIVCGVDEHADVVNRAYQELVSNDHPPHGGGAVTLILESRQNAEQRGARIRGTVGKSVGVLCAGRDGQSPTCRLRERIRKTATMLKQLGPVDALARRAHLPSVDRMERLAIARAYRKRGGQSSAPPEVKTPRQAGLPGLAILFSAGPLVDLAAFLLAQHPNKTGRRIGVLCSGEYGASSAVVELP